MQEPKECIVKRERPVKRGGGPQPIQEEFFKRIAAAAAGTFSGIGGSGIRSYKTEHGNCVSIRSGRMQ